MKIDRRLNLVVPLYEDTQDASPVIAYVHSVPLSMAVVDRWFIMLGKTYNAIMSEGFGMAAGPAHAARILRHLATANGVWTDSVGKEGSREVGVENGLLAEIRRLTNVLLPADGKWKMVPWAVASEQKMISEEDVSEVENAIVFFIAAYATLNRGQREAIITKSAEVWGAQLTSLDITAFGSSLRTSTVIDNSGGTSPAPAKDDAGLANATVDGKRRSVPV